MLRKWACRTQNTSMFFLCIICIISQKPSNQGKVEYTLFICVALVAVFKCPVCLFACTVLSSVAVGTREATHFLSRKTPVKTHQTHDSLWFQNNAHAMCSDLWGILPSSVSASGTGSGPSRERSRGSRAWRTAYFKHFMNIVWCVSGAENKSQSTCPFGIYKRNWNLTVSGGIKTLDMIKYNNLPGILQSLTLRPPFLCL